MHGGAKHGHCHLRAARARFFLKTGSSTGAVVAVEGTRPDAKSFVLNLKPSGRVWCRVDPAIRLFSNRGLSSIITHQKFTMMAAIPGLMEKDMPSYGAFGREYV